MHARVVVYMYLIFVMTGQNISNDGDKGMLYEHLISVLSNESSGIYTESIWIEVKPYFTVEKCTLIIFDNEKIQKINLNREDTGFVDIQVIF